MKSLAAVAVGALLVASAMTAAAEWQYDETVDKMSGKTVRTATTTSDNSLSLNFPYQGENHGLLQVRQHPKYGLDVIVYVEKGQILCRSFDGCVVAIKFGDGAPQSFKASEAADHDSQTIFINDTKRFLANAQKAKRILVQVPFFQNGEQVLEFTGPPLEWNRKPAAGKR